MWGVMTGDPQAIRTLILSEQPHSHLSNTLSFCTSLTLGFPGGISAHYSTFLPKTGVFKIFACQYNSCKILYPILISVSSITKAIEYLSSCLSTIYIFSFGKFLFLCLVHLPIGITGGFFLVGSQELFFKHTVHISTVSILCIENIFCYSQTFRMNLWLPQGRIGGGEG